MFRGINALVMDEKGRIAIPARYRDQLLEQSQGQLIITIDIQERCLTVYPFPVWENVEQKLCRLPEFRKEVSRLQRLLLGHACEVLMDKQGRLLLPVALREFAGLGKQLTLLGQGEKLEIWDKALWEQRSYQWLAEGIEVETDKVV